MATIAALFLSHEVTMSSPAGEQMQPVDPPWPDRPNILWLVAEDLGVQVPPFGDQTIETPALSRLAAEGVRFTHVYSPSGVCAPSRAALATGMYPSHIGAQHMRTGPWYKVDVSAEDLAADARQFGREPYEALPPPEVKMHSEYLRLAGYYTSNNDKEDYQFRKPMTAWDDSSETAHWRNRNPEQPFFSIFNFFVTHESQIWAKTGDPLLIPEDVPVPIPPYLPNTEPVRRDVRRMYSNIVEMDRQVGEVLAALEADGLLEETIVFWFSDHGGPLPRQKRLLYDSGIRVPLIIRFPNKWRAGETDDQLISFIDFLPTILSLAGMEPPQCVEGRVFLGAHGTTEPRTYIHAAADRFDEHVDKIRAVRDHRFKYLRNLRPEQGYYLPLAYREQMATMQELLRLRDVGGLDASQQLWFRSEKPLEELFDTETDPHELINLAEDPRYAEKLQELRAAYEEWSNGNPDLGLLPEAEYLASIWPGGNQPATAAPEAARTGDSVAISCATAGASIGYQALEPGQSPGLTWSVYDGPVVLSDGERLVCCAHRIGYRPSENVEVRPAPVPPENP